MDNFLKVDNVTDIDSMYGKEVYFTNFPDEPEGHFIYRGTLLGYGAYGKKPDYKLFCVYVDRGDGYWFVDYIQDRCFKSREDYETFKQQRKEKNEGCFTVDRLRKILNGEEGHIDVKVKVGDIVYPICSVVDQAKSIKEPAFVFKANTEKGREWERGTSIVGTTALIKRADSAR